MASRQIRHALTLLSIFSSLVPFTLTQNNSTNDTLALNITFVTTNYTTVDIYVPQTDFLTNGTFLVAPEPEQKRISYADAHGLAIVDGDIILATVADIQAATGPEQSKLRARGLSFLHNDKARKWTNGVLYYRYESQTFKDEKKEAFELATKLWKDRLPHLYFQEVDFPPPADILTDNVPDGGAITLRGPHAAPDYCKRCSFSPVGRAGWLSGGVWRYSQEANQMILGPCFSVESCAGVYAHELGHSLGLWHEQMRPDRNENIIIHCDNIESVVDAAGATITPDCGNDLTCRIGGCAFRMLVESEVDYSGPYDRNSIMHYHTTAFSKDGSKTITGKPPFADPNPGSAPTLLDAQKVCNLYFEVCRAVCGDGILSPGEVCDDGNNIDGDGCAANCQSITDVRCGNGRLDPGEICDLGPNNGKPGQSCGVDCKPTSVCGDGIVDSTVEDCDEGPQNGQPGSTCGVDCKTIPTSGTCDIGECGSHPGSNNCHITTSCIKVEGSGDPSRYLCACRHGFRGLDIDPGNTNGQVRIPATKWPSQKGRVFVNPGTECNQLCSGWTLGADGCTEVSEVGSCF